MFSLWPLCQKYKYTPWEKKGEREKRHRSQFFNPGSADNKLYDKILCTAREDVIKFVLRQPSLCRRACLRCLPCLDCWGPFWISSPGLLEVVLQVWLQPGDSLAMRTELSENRQEWSLCGGAGGAKLFWNCSLNLASYAHVFCYRWISQNFEISCDLNTSPDIYCLGQVT